MAEILDGIADEQLSESHKRLKLALMAELTASMDLKEMEQKLKDEIVQENQYYKKDNTTPDYAKVKMPLLKQAIEIVENEGKNKLADQLDLLDIYISDIKSKRISPAAINGYLRKLKMIAEAKENIKDIKENMKSELNSDVVEALMMLAKIDVGIEKERMEAEGGASSKPKKDKSEIVELIQKIKAKLRK